MKKINYSCFLQKVLYENKDDINIKTKCKNIKKNNLIKLTQELKSLAFATYKYYNVFNIEKKDKSKRIIYSPKSKLKQTQKNIIKNFLIDIFNKKLEENPILKKIIFGFVPGKSIIDMVKIHKNNKIFIKMDISDFFGSITKKRVYGLLINNIDLIYNKSNKEKKYYYLKMITNILTYKGILTQGSPASPIISNIIASSFDIKIYNYIKKYQKTMRRRLKDKSIIILYSRYADDIVLSIKGKNNFKYYKKDILILRNKISLILKQNGFIENEEKFGLFHEGKKEKILGLIISNKKDIFIDKKLRTKIYNIIYSINKIGWEETAIYYWLKEFLSFINKKDRINLIIQDFQIYYRNNKKYLKNLNKEDFFDKQYIKNLINFYYKEKYILGKGDEKEYLIKRKELIISYIINNNGIELFKSIIKGYYNYFIMINKEYYEKKIDGNIFLL